MPAECRSARATHHSMAEAADFNGDGLIDIVAIDERTGVAVYLGRRGGGSHPAFRSETKIVPVRAGDR